MGRKIIEFPRNKNIWPTTSETYTERHEEYGRQVKRVLKASRKKLSWEDRSSIARRIHSEMRAFGVKPGDLAIKAGLAHGTKELNKLAMKEGKDPRKAQLMAYPDRYYRVIEALAKLTRQNHHLVLDKITVGTAVHPTRASQLSEVEKTLRALELLADQVDKELGLFDQCRETFRWKVEMLSRGDRRNWPHDPLEENGRAIDPTMKEFKLDDRYTFWGRPTDDYMDGLGLEPLIYFPHAYIGILGDWLSWGIAGDMAEIQKAREYLMEEYERVPKIPCPEGEFEPNISIPMWEIEHAWVILYPDKQMNTIVPVMIKLMGDAGAVMERLTLSKLIELQQVEFIGNAPITAYERLVDMVAEKEEGGKESALVQRWIKTGRNFYLNPYLREANRMKRAREQRDLLFSEEVNDENE